MYSILYLQLSENAREFLKIVNFLQAKKFFNKNDPIFRRFSSSVTTIYGKNNVKTQDGVAYLAF